MNIKRDSYLQQLISCRFDGLAKVITGIRRCGKSYLLKNLYREYLLQDGVKSEQIISIEQTKEYYLFADEIQMSDQVVNPYNHAGAKITFYDALNDLRSLPNLDVYVTGEATKFVCILLAFRNIMRLQAKIKLQQNFACSPLRGISSLKLWLEGMYIGKQWYDDNGILISI